MDSKHTGYAGRSYYQLTEAAMNYATIASDVWIWAPIACLSEQRIAKLRWRENITSAITAAALSVTARRTAAARRSGRSLETLTLAVNGITNKRWKRREALHQQRPVLRRNWGGSLKVCITFDAAPVCYYRREVMSIIWATTAPIAWSLKVTTNPGQPLQPIAKSRVWR